MDSIFNKKNENEKDDFVDDKEVTNLNNPKQNPNQQKKIKKYKSNSKKKSKSSCTINPDIKYQNNKKKKQRKIVKRNVSGDNRSDKEDNDPMPGLQDRDRSNSSSDDDNVDNRGDDDSGMTANRNEYLFEESDNWEDRCKYVLNKLSSIPITKWLDNNTDDEEYDGDNDEE